MFRRIPPMVLAQLMLTIPLFAAATPPPAAEKTTPSREDPLAAVPYTPGLDPTAMDRGSDPCTDFYQYACGGWMKNNPIPPDESHWDVYSKLSYENMRFLWGILNDLAAKKNDLTPNGEKLGIYFAACMNEKEIEQKGAAPLADQLAAISALRTREGLPELLARLQLETGSDMFFGFSSAQDYDDASKVIAFASAGGLGLPDREYYLKKDARSTAILASYTAHIAQMLELSGSDKTRAAADARGIISLESALAKASLSRVDLRDPHRMAHKFDRKHLDALTPGFAWEPYLKSLGLTQVRVLNVTEPAFFRELQRQWQKRSLDDIKAYLRWHTVHDSAAALSSPFVQADFDFYHKTLRGVPEPPPRWKRCVDFVSTHLGEALGQEYVRRSFSPAMKEKAQQMTREIEQAMVEEIGQLRWMGPATRRRALTKLAAVVNKIGYPDKWRDYSAYQVHRDDFAGNVRRGNEFEERRQLAKIGRPLDRGEWSMTPQTVNAYYDPQMNDINFPAGVLQPPLYDDKMDSAPGYGNTGSTIGHELTHGFDDEGRLFDARGNLKNWWTAADAREFNRRTQCVVDQYAQYTVIDDIKINSKLTLGEDVADLGGLILAFEAWRKNAAPSTPAARDGLSPEQRFFVGFAQWACSNDRPEDLRVKALTDVHSPARYRVNGVVANMPEFAQVFGCKVGQPMVRAKPCRIW